MIKAIKGNVKAIMEGSRWLSRGSRPPRPWSRLSKTMSNHHCHGQVGQQGCKFINAIGVAKARENTAKTIVKTAKAMVKIIKVMVKIQPMEVIKAMVKTVKYKA